MGEVVSDATILIFLGKLRRLDWLRTAYETVLIPEVVYDEVVVRGRELGAPDAALVDDAIEAGWIEVRTVDSQAAVERFDLEAGETAVLSLSIERGHGEVLRRGGGP